MNNANQVVVRERPILFSAEMVRAILEGRKTQTRRVVKPQPTLIESSGRWRWPLPKRAHFPGCCTEVVTASREWWEYAPGEAFPYRPGDRLWVRESWWHHKAPEIEQAGFTGGTVCNINGRGVLNPLSGRFDNPFDPADYPHVWRRRPSIHMPRWASRITLEITDVRVERVQEITEADARAEGIADCPDCEFEPWGRGALDDPISHANGGKPWSMCHGPCAAQSYKESFRDLWDTINGKRDDGAYAWERNPWVWVVSFSPISAVQEPAP